MFWRAKKADLINFCTALQITEFFLYSKERIQSTFLEFSGKFLQIIWFGNLVKFYKIAIQHSDTIQRYKTINSTLQYSGTKVYFGFVLNTRSKDCILILQMYGTDIYYTLIML